MSNRVLLKISGEKLMEESGPIGFEKVEETATVLVDETGIIGKVYALGDEVEVPEERDGYRTNIYPFFTPLTLIP